MGQIIAAPGYSGQMPLANAYTRLVHLPDPCAVWTVSIAVDTYYNVTPEVLACGAY